MIIIAVLYTLKTEDRRLSTTQTLEKDSTLQQHAL